MAIIIKIFNKIYEIACYCNEKSMYSSDHKAAIRQQIDAMWRQVNGQ